MYFKDIQHLMDYTDMLHEPLHKLIYLAEDDEDDRILFLEVLKEIHPEIGVKVFEDGQRLLDSLHEAENDKPKILFLDINMPCKNGFECLKEIKCRVGCLSGVKIIMFSTSSSTLHIELSYKLGADGYAIKPGSFNELKDLLQEIIAINWSKASRNRTEFVLDSKK